MNPGNKFSRAANSPPVSIALFAVTWFHIFAWGLFGCSSRIPPLDRPFDRTAWIKGDYEMRGSMLCDLLGIEVNDWRRYDNLLTPDSRFNIITRREVEELLGPPDGEYLDRMSIHDNQGQTHTCEMMISYDVGLLNERRDGDIPFHLGIGFNDSGCVSLIHVSD